MKLITYRHAGLVRTGAVVGNGVRDLTDYIAALTPATGTDEHADGSRNAQAPAGLLRLLQAGPDALEALVAELEKNKQENISSESIELLAPIPRPGKIVGIGRNYGDHAKETGIADPEQPRIIGMFPSSVAAPGTAVKRPPGIVKLDFEAELAVVIGQYARNVSEHDAMACIAGYSIINDISARELQFDISPPQTTLAKSMDGFSPMGPWLVTADEIPDPQALTVSSWVNGTLMQRGETAHMLFPVATLIAYISRFMTLEPGDVIATGTPAGSGAFRTPPQYLQPGDHIRIEISRLGSLEHSIC